MAQGDESIGPLWAVQHVEGVRPDVTLVSSDVFPASWYQADLRTQGLSVPPNSTVLALREANASRPFDVIGNLPDKSLDNKYFYYRNGPGRTTCCPSRPIRRCRKWHRTTQPSSRPITFRRTGI